jgi:hypothetical protein
MKRNDIKVGGTYVAKVTGKLARIRIDAEDPNGGWSATNLETKRRVRIKSARRLRHESDSETSDAPDSPTPIAAPDSATTRVDADIIANEDASNDTDGRRLSALDAAALVLANAPAPMRCGDLITAMAAKGLWTSPNGKTPHATLNSALIREIARKGDQSRFRRCGRGMFKLNKVAEQ